MHPLLVLAVLLCTLLMRKKLHHVEQQETIHRLGSPFSLLLQPYSFFLLCLLVYYIYVLCCFFDLMARYDGFNPAKFHRPPANSTADDQDMEEYELDGVLLTFCKASPVLIGITFCITVVHLWMHLPVRQPHFHGELRWFPTTAHDLAMQVVALPLTYGMFAFDNVLQVLLVCTGESYQATHPERQPGGERAFWDRTVDIMNQAYDTNFELADLYEAWALRCFGLLCFTLVNRQVLLETPTVKFLIANIRDHLKRVAAGGTDYQLLKDLILMNDPEKMLFNPLLQTSRLGVMVFVYTYAAKSAYSLTLTSLAEAPFSLNLCGEGGVFKAACSLRPYADGAAMLASTLAIANIVLFEHNLKDVLDSKEEFRPVAKFLAVKVLVSIVFFQNFALNVLLGSMLNLSQVQIKLWYACLICCELFPLSLLVFHAWRPRAGDWHDGDLHEGQGHDSHRVDFPTAAEDFMFMRTESFSRSRQPRGAMSVRPPLPHEITATLELRGPVDQESGDALTKVISSLSDGRITAVYKHAALYRVPSPASFRSARASGAAGGSSELLGSGGGIGGQPLQDPLASQGSGSEFSWGAPARTLHDKGGF